HIELSELGLPVGTEVFIPVAPGDLVITFHSRHHEQLLEELWGLWQGIPGSGVETRWHEEVASTLGCGAGEGGVFDLAESRIIEHVPSCFVHMCAEPDRVSRVGPTQIEVTVLQPLFFAHVNPLVQCCGNL